MKSSATAREPVLVSLTDRWRNGMQEAMAPGFFGKVPARGDFLARRVPAAISAVWETWLQELTTTVRQAGDRGWQDAWLTAPLWHFVLGRDVAAPHGAAGVLLASADRVGRLFPFTLIAAAGSEARLDAAAWSREAEALALGALEDDFDPGSLDAALIRLGPPPPPHGPNGPPGLWTLVLADDWPEDEAAQPGPGPDQSEWWTRGSDRIDPVRLRCKSLPGPRTATAMVLGGLESTVAGS